MKTLLTLITVLICSNGFAQNEFYNNLPLKKSRWVWGGGLVVSELPVANAEFKMPIGYIAYEYVFTDADKFWGMTPGLNIGATGMNGFIPLPTVELTGTMNYGEGLAGRISVGGFYDVLIGGHAGLLLKGGVILDDHYELTILGVPVGSQPVKPYSEFIDNGPEAIKLPYFGLMLTFR